MCPPALTSEKRIARGPLNVMPLRSPHDSLSQETSFTSGSSCPVSTPRPAHTHTPPALRGNCLGCSFCTHHPADASQPKRRSAPLVASASHAPLQAPNLHFSLRTLHPPILLSRLLSKCFSNMEQSFSVREAS